MASWTAYMQNAIVDAVMRGQPLPSVPVFYFGLHLSSYYHQSAEISTIDPAYQRIAIPANMINFSGTQGAGSVTESTGTSGVISNNVAISFPPASVDWGRIESMSMWDAPTFGNMWVLSNLTQTADIFQGDPFTIPPSRFNITLS